MVYEKKIVSGGISAQPLIGKEKSFRERWGFLGRLSCFLTVASPRYKDDNLLVGTCHLSLTCPAPAWSVKSGDFMSVSVSVPTLPHCPPNKGTHLLILWNNYTTSLVSHHLTGQIVTNYNPPTDRSFTLWFRRKKKCEREGGDPGDLTEDESESEEECQHLLSRSLNNLYSSPSSPLGQAPVLTATL